MTSPEVKLDVRAYQPSDEVYIRELFRLSFGRELPEARWKWRYRDCPAGQAWIDLAWHGETLVGHRAETPLVLRIRGRDYRAGMAGGVMTHPLYRGHGLYVRLSQVQFAQMARAGIAVGLGFPNSFSHRITVDDIGFSDIHEVPTFRLDLSSHPLPASLLFPGEDSRTQRVTELRSFDQRFDRLWEQVKDDHVVIARRDQAHLCWRYADNPTATYRILACEEGGDLLGYVVCKHYQQELQVVDLLTVQDVHVGMHLVTHAARLALDGGATALSLWLNVSHPLHRRLEKLGFRNGEPVTYFVGKVLRPELPEELVFQFRNWYLTMGDSDVY